MRRLPDFTGVEDTVVYRLGIGEINNATQLVSVWWDQLEPQAAQKGYDLFRLVELKGTLGLVVPVVDRLDSGAHLEHQLENAAHPEDPGQLRQGHIPYQCWEYMLDYRVAQHEIEMATGKLIQCDHTQPQLG